MPIFAKLNSVQLHRITASAVDRSSEPATPSFSRGRWETPCTSLTAAGRARERRRCPHHVDGDSFGELSMLSDEARSASIVATSVRSRV